MRLAECCAAARGIGKSSARSEAGAGDGSCGVKTADAGAAVGARLVRLDGQRKVEGSDIFGADEIPKDDLGVRVVRSPHHRARFQFGDLDTFAGKHPGIVLVLTAKDVPGVDCYGVIRSEE